MFTNIPILHKLHNYLADRYHLYCKKNEIKELLEHSFSYLVENCDNDSDSLLKRIMLQYHVIEKGLTMPARRIGFGQETLYNLILSIKKYIQLFGNNNEQVSVAIGVVKEYMDLHKSVGFSLPQYLLEEAMLLLNNEDYLDIHQININREDYFSQINSPFDKFSYSRHSLRNYVGEVPMEDLLKAIDLAQNAPSACNRQASRIRIIKDKSLIEKVFEVQRGNRGFGHLADKLLLVTTDMRFWDILTCFGGYVDGGIYTMNLLYALHFYKIGSCPLNACFNPEEESKIRKMLKIPNYENLVVFIAVGKVPDSFMLANSQRYKSATITSIL